MEKISTLWYSICQGVKNIKRNKMFSITSIVTMTACLFLFGIFFFLVSNVQYMVKHMEKNVSVTAFLEEGLSDNEIMEIGWKLEERSDVEKVEFVSAEEAWKRFQKETFEDQPELADTFGEDNPLADSESYEIYVKNVEKQQQLVHDLEDMKGIRKVNSSNTTAKALTNFNRLISVVSVFLIGILLAVSLFLISTTVSVGISVRKEEIGIMRLIGATDFFVQGPFIVEGMVIGLIGAMLPLFILAFMYYRFINWITQKFGLLSEWLVFMDLKTELSVLVPVCLGIGVGIGLLGSCFTVKKHLRV